ncbi:trimethylamine methyltransferase family protein [Desulfosediminicola flagellatus]|uniref:trimethylamine methyltransferase family protein n=1 Tax=Desulfosediminicola flagellatus TaxID=2569541 RepID=UPI00142EAC48|nr:trimethylamine methyltransferase family protein [Desulfosediminicola flagellatus]
MQTDAKMMEKQRFGNDELYQQMQQDALLLIESYGVAVSPESAEKLLGAMPADEAARVIYSADTGRIYITQDVIEDCLDRVRQGMDYWPTGFGTGGMAAYIVDGKEPRSPEGADMKQLAELFGKTDILTNLQSSFNICSRVKRSDMATRAEIETSAIDDMIAGANGKLIMPTILSEGGYDRLQHYAEKGHRVGAALSIISTYMTISDEMVDPLLKTVTRDLPYIMNAMPIGGLTGPYSMTALASLAQAEAIFGLVLGQLIRPGIKAINAAMPTIADMTSKDMPMKFGSISNTMINILLAELNMYLGIPCCQSSCSHQRDTLDDVAIDKSAEIFSLVARYDYQILRHMFGFSAQLNDFGIDNMQKQIDQFHQVMANPIAVELPEPAQYDAEGLDAIFEGFERRDFRALDHTLKNIGKSFNS